MSEDVIDLINEAFATVEPHPNWCLSDSTEGVEPAALIKEFTHVPDWRTLNPDFLDSSPDGYGTALCFFSDEAFRYYLPAYLIADLREQLEKVDPLPFLTRGFDKKSENTLINSRRYGERTWRDYALFRFSTFNTKQIAAIVEYLNNQFSRSNRGDFDKKMISEALINYWNNR